ncbi:serine/threonine protein phosphatase PrpC [Dyadobacter jejuensis]|uniref:Serine/threonine protein phosphatase PrpC n=1 Tax=Dyadobacter jejuensis TaxID=1082580 RepID=A0A316AA67_9BACT|nr:protein phosphatase 2C domain-containing protein [Dyadobacter jejuensis]PWJ53900.1 serine/threonine protein phosphatase PrpC [Dyadobacter jejuensis]
MLEQLDFYGLSDQGRHRDTNEDCYIAQSIGRREAVLLAAIDGVGGYEGGEVAAGIAQETVIALLSGSAQAETVLTEPVLAEPVQQINEAITEANNRIYEKARTDAILSAMGCVLTVAIADPVARRVYYGHVGDTRLYLWSEGELRKLSRDHSIVGLFEDLGQLTEEEAMQHPKRNEILRLLGRDLQQPNDENFINTGTADFVPGDMLLLCSDGLTDLVTKKEISLVLSHELSVKAKAQALVDAANQAGGHDNITVVLAHFRQ